MRCMIKDRRGSASIEFAVIAPMVLAVVFFIAEFSFFMLGNSAVERAASRAAEAIRLDPARGFNADDVRHAACGGVFMSFACNAGSLRITVHPAGAVAAGGSYARSATRGLPDVVRVDMKWPELLVVTDLTLSAVNGSRTMSSSIVVHPDPAIPAGAPVTGGLQWNPP